MRWLNSVDTKTFELLVNGIKTSHITWSVGDRYQPGDKVTFMEFVEVKGHRLPNRSLSKIISYIENPRALDKQFVLFGFKNKT